MKKTTFGELKAGDSFRDASGVRMIKRDEYRALEPLYGVVFLIRSTDKVTKI